MAYLRLSRDNRMLHGTCTVELSQRADLLVHNLARPDVDQVLEMTRNSGYNDHDDRGQDETIRRHGRHQEPVRQALARRDVKGRYVRYAQHSSLSSLHRYNQKLSAIEPQGHAPRVVEYNAPLATDPTFLHSRQNILGSGGGDCDKSHSS